MTKTNRNFKKVMVCLMAVVFAIGTAAVPAITKKSIVNASSKPVIEEVEYKGNGKVEVDFYGKVQYKNPKVVVKGNGKSCSTLLMLVSAFAGHDVVMRAYREAVAERYCFFSFGDAMLIG